MRCKSVADCSDTIDRASIKQHKSFQIFSFALQNERNLKVLVYSNERTETLFLTPFTDKFVPHCMSLSR